MGYRLSGSYWFSSAVEVMLGAGYDENAVPDSTLEPALIDMDKVTASLGARFKMLDDSLALAATFTQVVYFTRDINPESQEPALYAMRQQVLARTECRRQIRAVHQPAQPKRRIYLLDSMSFDAIKAKLTRLQCCREHLRRRLHHAYLFAGPVGVEKRWLRTRLQQRFSARRLQKINSAAVYVGLLARTNRDGT